MPSFPQLKTGQALPLTRTVAGVLAALNLAMAEAATAEPLWFPPALISGAHQDMAGLDFLRLGGQMPGTYEVDILVNGEYLFSRPVTFRADEENMPDDKHGPGLMPCLSGADWAAAGVREDILHPSAEQDCLRAESLSPDVATTFRFQKMQLDLSIPRALLVTRARGEIPAERWDEGISAAFLNYSFSGLQAHARNRNNHSHYLTLGSGLNLYAVEPLKNGYYKKFPDTLYFNDCMILALCQLKQKVLFFPISWREEDQVSNNKLTSFGISLLKLCGRYLRSPRDFVTREWREKIIDEYTCTEIPVQQ